MNRFVIRFCGNRTRTDIINRLVTTSEVVVLNNTNIFAVLVLGGPRQLGVRGGRRGRLLRLELPFPSFEKNPIFLEDSVEELHGGVLLPVVVVGHVDQGVVLRDEVVHVDDVNLEIENYK